MALESVVQDIDFHLLDTEINMPGTKAVFLHSWGKQQFSHWAESTLLCKHFCNKSGREGSTGVRTVHCDYYALSKLSLIQRSDEL